MRNQLRGIRRCSGARFMLTLLLAVACTPVVASADEDAEIKDLIEGLKTQEDSKSYYTAIELAKFKGKAVPLLQEGLTSPNAGVRKWCASALTNIVGGYRETSGRPDAAPAGSALLTALERESDPKVAWYMVQAVGAILPDSKTAIPILLRTLSSAEPDLQRLAVEALGNYGKDAASSKPALIDMLKKSGNDRLGFWIVNALSEIGVDQADARTLSLLQLPPSGDSTGEVLRLLLDYPEPALHFLKLHPDVLKNVYRGRTLEALLRVLKDTSPETAALRAYLLTREDLPSIAMVQVGSKELLPRIQARIAAADPHYRFFLDACARALGGPVAREVEISETKPGNFRPKSAHPGTDLDRWADGGGHGDGKTQVLITGRLLMSDGKPAIKPRFFDINDRMLLGLNLKDPTPLMRYDEKTGRFVFFTTVFAAFAMGGGQKEPGPYQTGSARMLIEAEGAKPLLVEFYDEMPDVKITLNSSQ